MNINPRPKGRGNSAYSNKIYELFKLEWEGVN